MRIYDEINEAKLKRQKKFAVLIDPDKFDLKRLEEIIQIARNAHVDYFLVGGSLLVDNQFELVLKSIKLKSQIPVILFPGNTLQVNQNADAILLLSLISGRNSDLLIGKHVEAAPRLKRSGLEVIPTGYILIDGGKATSVSYMSNTQPIPADKVEIAQCTAMAGSYLGLKMIYLEAGSGAFNPVSKAMVNAVASSINIPIIVGGGIRTADQARDLVEAGADMLVVGNAIEENPELIIDFSATIHSLNKVTS